MNAFRQQIKKRRLALGLTQEHIAIGIGEDRHNYNNFENGRRNLNDAKIIRLAEVLQVTEQTLKAWQVIDITTPEILKQALEELERIKAEEEILEAAEDTVYKAKGKNKSEAQKNMKALKDLL